LTLVRLLECRANVLLVEGLDALDGSSVLAIKPCEPPYDAPQSETRVPPGVFRLAY